MTTIKVLIACFPTIAAIVILIRTAARIGLFDDPEQAGFLPLRMDRHLRESRGLDAAAETPVRRRTLPLAKIALILIATVAIGEAVGTAIYANSASGPPNQLFQEAGE